MSSPNHDAEGDVKRASTTPTDPLELGKAVAHSPLFKVSGEVRNKIYRLVLVELPLVDFDPSTSEPALLATYHPIRSETASIYYIENTFAVDVSDYDSKALATLTRRFRQAGVGATPHEITSFVTFTTEPHWANVERWTSRFLNDFVQQSPGLRSHVGTEDLQYNLVATIFILLEILTDQHGVADFPRHELTKAILDSQRKLLISIDERWAIDHEAAPDHESAEQKTD